MSDKSSIEWTDATWNPVRGCTKVSPGCAHCYAETFAERFRGVAGHPYEQGFDLRLVPEKLAQPLAWKKPRMVFVNSMSDLFHESVPDDYIDQVFAVTWSAQWHNYQILTKRAERMARYFNEPNRAARIAWAAWEFFKQRDPVKHAEGLLTPCDFVADVRLPLDNVWLGVSCEDQQRADERIPHLLRTPAAVRFVSAEPLLGPIDFLSMTADPPNSGFAVTDGFGRFDGEPPSEIGWIIVGGESGPGARMCDIAWIHSIIEQCQAAGVPVFVKQLGAFPYADIECELARVSDAKGGDPAEWPAELRVREFPATASLAL